MLFSHFVLALLIAIILNPHYQRASSIRDQAALGRSAPDAPGQSAGLMGGRHLDPPFGPLVWGITWLPFQLSDLIVAMVFSAASSPNHEEPAV